MADEPASDPLIEHDRHLFGCNLVRIEPLDRALARAAADPLGTIEIGGMQRRGEVIVALHRSALARDRRHREAMVRGQIGAPKAAARRQHHPADAGGGRGALRLGDALHGEAGRFRTLGARFERGDRGQFWINEIEIGKIARQFVRVSETREGVLGRDLGHGDCTLGEC